MDIQRIRYFISIEREKSFTRASEKCFISQPSLSNQIKKLEEEVGGILFYREKAGVQLTGLGAEFLKHAQAIMYEVERANEFCERSSDTLMRPVRLGAIPTIAPYLMPNLISHIKKDFPNVELEIFEDTTTAQLAALENRQVDFVLLSPPTRLDDQLRYLSVMKDELLITLPKGSDFPVEEGINLSSLKSESLILLEDAHCLSQQSKTYCQTAGIDPKVSVRTAQIETLLGMVEQGMGYTFTPRVAVSSNQHRNLSFYPITPERYYREIQLVWHQKMHSTHTHELLHKTLQSWTFKVI